MKLFIPILLALGAFPSYSQWTGPDASSNIYYNGNVGIGTVPAYKLHIKHALAAPLIVAESSEAQFVFNRHGIEMRARPTYQYTPFVSIYEKGGKRLGYLGYRTDAFAISLENGYNFLVAGGNMGIGVVDTKGYKLAVAGNMAAEEVVVKLKEQWPDFVFKKDYALPTLKAVSDHIEKHGHLPGIPVSEDVVKNGLSVGAMSAKLLQKIEELTLYAIEERRRSEQLIQRIASLEKKLENVQQ